MKNLILILAFIIPGIMNAQVIQEYDFKAIAIYKLGDTLDLMFLEETQVVDGHIKLEIFTNNEDATGQLEIRSISEDLSNHIQAIPIWKVSIVEPNTYYDRDMSHKIILYKEGSLSYSTKWNEARKLYEFNYMFIKT